jgi:deoxyinosine 3'endonuclease (endonuclease V)
MKNQTLISEFLVHLFYSFKYLRLCLDRFAKLGNQECSIDLVNGHGSTHSRGPEDQR